MCEKKHRKHLVAYRAPPPDYRSVVDEYLYVPFFFVSIQPHCSPASPSYYCERTFGVAKGGAKKGGASAKVSEGGGGGAAGARRATVSELKGLVEVRALCQSARGGAGSVSGEGRPLLQVGVL